MEKKFKKTASLIGKIIFVFIFGSGGALFANYYLLPKMSNYDIFSKSEFLQKFKENVTIINKTEQIVVEEESVNSVASQASNAVVDIISISNAINPRTNIQENGIGKGVLVTGDGLIATYRTSIYEKNAVYKVLLINGTSYDAKLLGIDEFTNLAFLKIEASNLSTVAFSNSDDAFSGKRLIAINTSPGEFRNEFATGILNSINRTFNISGQSVSSSEKLEGVFEADFIYEDKYIGAPVIGFNGELVGIVGNVEIDNKNKFFQVPTNMIKKAMELARSEGLETRVNLGVSYIPVTKEFSLANNLEIDRGVLIYSASGNQGLAILSGSPAQKAGLLLNDIILKVGEQEVNLENPLSNILSGYKKGDAAEFTVLRKAEEIKISVQL